MMKNGLVVQHFPNSGTHPAQTLTTPLLLSLFQNKIAMLFLNQIPAWIDFIWCAIYRLTTPLIHGRAVTRSGTAKPRGYRT